MKLGIRARFALALAGLAGYVVAGAGLLGLGVWSSADAVDQGVLTRTLAEQAAFLVVGGVLYVAGLALFLGRIFAAYVVPLRRLAADTRLITAANPGHRLESGRPQELAALVDAVNELAGEYQAAREAADTRSAADRAALEADRNRLAALMSELSVAVLVCNVEGQILLYNAAARELLSADPAGRAAVGLGRSIFGLIDRELFGHAVDRIQAAAGVFHAATTGPGDLLLRVRMTPVGGETGGYVLTLEDVTRRAEAGHRRDAALRALSEGTRAPVAAIRAAIESILDYPDMAVGERERFAEIIREETLRLSDHVERTLAGGSGYLTDRWQLDDVRGADVLTTVARSVRTVQGVTVAIRAPAEEQWLEVDTYPIAQAVTDLVRLLHAEQGVTAVEFCLGDADGHAAFDLRWPADAADRNPEDTVRRWSSEPRVGGLLERHDGEAWFAVDHYGPYVRILLPWSRTPPVAGSPVPPALTRTPSRPEFYDFDLFRAVPAGTAYDDRRLDELAYTVFDTETTGLEPSQGDEIISIGAARIVNGRLLLQETYEQLVDPGRSVPAASQRIHGITPAMLTGQPAIDDVLPDFERFAQGSVLVGHNVAFDLKFLALKEASSGVRLSQPVLDTLLLSPVAHPDHADHSLEAIAGRLGVRVLGRHTALGDALLTGEIFVRLIPLLADRGITTLGEARVAVRRTHQARISATLYKKY